MIILATRNWLATPSRTNFLVRSAGSLAVALIIYGVFIAVLYQLAPPGDPCDWYPDRELCDPAATEPNFAILAIAMGNVLAGSVAFIVGAIVMRMRNNGPAMQSLERKTIRSRWVSRGIIAVMAIWFAAIHIAFSM